MMFRTLGLATEALVMRGLSSWEDHGDHVVQRTPGEPDYWFGNQVILPEWPADPGTAIALFERHFPGARHGVISVDRPAPSRLPPLDTLPGWRWDLSDFMALSGTLSPVRTPDGIILRPVESDADWAGVQALQLEIGIEEGYEGGLHETYVAGRNAARRRQIARGEGAWFAAFDGDRVVGDMGIFHDARLARYQAVETAASHRRRGIASALLRHCYSWVRGRVPTATVVIAAETGSAAGRLYGKAGFAPVERIAALYRPGDGGAS